MISTTSSDNTDMQHSLLTSQLKHLRRSYVASPTAFLNLGLLYIQNILHFTNEVLKSFVISLSCGWHYLLLALLRYSTIKPTEPYVYDSMPDSNRRLLNYPKCVLQMFLFQIFNELIVIPEGLEPSTPALKVPCSTY